MPLLDVPGKEGAVAPSHIVVAKLKAGVTIGFTVTLIVTGTAHCPAVGVNV